MLLIDNIKTYYGHIQALKGISLKIESGEIVTLIGANGAGKTTTLKTIAGLLKPKEGSVMLDSKNITGYPAHKVVKESVILVPEGRRVFSKLTVEENLKMGAYSRNIKMNKLNEEIKNIYAMFPRLEERKNQYAGTLSGGEQQMLAIGRGLMAKPKILLLDEPSMGISPIVVREIFHIIKNINKDFKTTIFLVEQNAKMALSVANRGYVIETGNIILEGTTEELKESEEVKKAYLGA